MGYENDFLEDSDSEFSSDEDGLMPPITEMEEDADPLPVGLELDELTKKAKVVTARFSLKARRAIEEHLEQRRLRQELDYFSEK